MGTDAGFNFEADQENVDKLEAMIDELDDITNSNGLGVACTPMIWKNDDGTYHFNAQTHWSYDGTNGRVLVEEAKKMMESKGIDVEIIDEWYA